MKVVTRILCFALLLAVTGICSADDHASLTRQLAKINAMSTDPNGRRVVSRFLSTTFKVSHSEVLAVRRQLNLNYGSTFLFFAMISSGLETKQLASDLGRGKTFRQIGEDRQFKWKHVAGKAKEFNKRLRD